VAVRFVEAGEDRRQEESSLGIPPGLRRWRSSIAPPSAASSSAQTATGSQLAAPLSLPVPTVW